MSKDKTHLHDARSVHFKYTEKNYIRMYRVVRGWRLLCALMAHSKKEKNDFGLREEARLFNSLPALPTPSKTTKIERHFATETAIDRGVDSLSNQLCLFAQLIQENEKYKTFEEQLGIKTKGFPSGCNRIGISEDYSAIEVREQTSHRQMSLRSLALMETVLRRVEFFKAIIESDLPWVDWGKKVETEFPTEFKESDVRDTTFGPRKGLSAEEHQHFGVTRTMTRRIASVDHRLHSMVNMIVEKKFPKWYVK